jgi:quercetin dioxygenase-like cupin family protein
MKIISVSSSIIAVTLFFLVSSAVAQDPAKVGPDIYKQKLSEKGVRVFEVSFEPGQKIGTHSHPDHVVYVMTAGTISITEVGKEAKTMDVKPGDAMFFPAQTHHAQNTGKTQLKLVVVELPAKQ